MADLVALSLPGKIPFPGNRDWSYQRLGSNGSIALLVTKKHSHGGIAPNRTAQLSGQSAAYG